MERCKIEGPHVLEEDYKIITMGDHVDQDQETELIASHESDKVLINGT